MMQEPIHSSGQQKAQAFGSNGCKQIQRNHMLLIRQGRSSLFIAQISKCLKQEHDEGVGSAHLEKHL